MLYACHNCLSSVTVVLSSMACLAMKIGKLTEHAIITGIKR